LSVLRISDVAPFSPLSRKRPKKKEKKGEKGEDAIAPVRRSLPSVSKERRGKEEK